MKIRSFIAINLPDEIKKEVGFLIEKLKEKNNSREIKWVKPENIHLTLHFLGYLDEEKIEQVKKIVRENIAGLTPVEIELKELGGFPSFQSPRILFIGGREKSKNKFIPQLQVKIGQELERIGLEIDKRPWRIHFTLARSKLPIKLSNINYQIPNLNFTVKSIDLMKSELTPAGARYLILESFSI